MIRGLSTAASGMMSDERLQQLLTNNLANSETPGFKSSNGELLAFPAQLQQLLDYGQTAGTPIGQMGTGVVFQEGVPMFLQGQLTQTGRNLDVAIVDGTPNGTYAAVAVAGPQGAALQSVNGNITAGAGGRLVVNGQPLAVIGPDGKPMAGVFAARNPAYQGSALYAANGKPDYDANGNPSYVFVNAASATVGQASQPGWEQVGLRVGSQGDMGNHSFFAVAYQSPEGYNGIALTRDGHFDVTNQNILVDASGNAVLPVDANGRPMQNARIQINPAYTGQTLFGPDGSPVTDTSGQPSYRVVSVGGQPIGQGRLGAVDADVTQLSPLGQTEFLVGGTFNPAQVNALLRPAGGTLKPGEQEQSTVDVTSTMMHMMAVVAQYEANQRMIQTEDSLLQKAVNDVGKVNA